MFRATLIIPEKNGFNIKLAPSDENRELELDYQLSLSMEECFQMVFQKSREIKEMLIANGHREPFEIIKRDEGCCGKTGKH